MTITDLLAGRGPHAELIALQKQGALPHPQSRQRRSAPFTYDLNGIRADGLTQISARLQPRRPRH
jgi:hypothetical protein